MQNARQTEQRLTVASLRPPAHKQAARLCAQTPISGLMPRDVFCIASDVSVEGLTAMLLELRLNTVVVDPVGRIVGVVSTAELLREVKDRGDDQERIPLRARAPRSIQLQLEGVGELADAGDRVIGALRARDVVRWLAESGS